MDENIATLIFAIIMGIGFGVWLISLRKALRMGCAETPQDPYSELNEPGADDPEAQSGTVTLRGDDPLDLSAALRRALVQLNFGAFASLYKIKECDDGRIIAKKTGPLFCNQMPGLMFTEANFVFEPTGRGTVDVHYHLGYGRLGRKLRNLSLLLILAVGLPVMCLVGFLIWYLVIPNPNPAVRWQVLQTLQISHALWPPYLFIGMYAAGRRRTKLLIENTIASIA